MSAPGSGGGPGQAAEAAGLSAAGAAQAPARLPEGLVARVARHLGQGPAEATRVVQAVLQGVADELVQLRQLTLPGFAVLRLADGKPTGAGPGAITFTPIDGLRRALESHRTAGILLVVPQHDTFAKVVDFHFTRTGWSVQVVHSVEHCLTRLRGANAGAGGPGGASTAPAAAAANLVIVDFTLPHAARLVEELKCARELNRIPVIALYPGERDPSLAPGFHVLPDERLVEPFEVHSLLTVAERALARAGEESQRFEQRLALQLSTAEPHLDRAAEVGARLFQEAALGEEAQVALGAAFREALQNAAQHGNRDDPKKRVRVQYALDKDKVTLVIADEGPGFDHRGFLARKAEQDAVAAARERHAEGRVGGLGLLLIGKCVDRLEFNEIGNQLTLVRYRRAQGAGAGVAS